MITAKLPHSFLRVKLKNKKRKVILLPRPRKEIDQKAFESLCGLQCTKEEICGFFDLTDKTLENWCRRTYKAGFSEVFKQKRGLGKISLRRHQWRLAEKSAAMAIWLGRNYLGQKEEPEEVAEVEDTAAFFDSAGLDENSEA